MNVDLHFLLKKTYAFPASYVSLPKGKTTTSSFGMRFLGIYIQGFMFVSSDQLIKNNTLFTHFWQSFGNPPNIYRMYIASKPVIHNIIKNTKICVNSYPVKNSMGALNLFTYNNWGSLYTFAFSPQVVFPLKKCE